MTNPRGAGLLLLVLLSAASTVVAATYKVSKDGRAPYTTVQSAVSAAKSGDEIVILDFAVYKEQVTIDSSKNRLTLRSENPELATKPVISFLDDIHVGPRNFEESQDQTKINFDMNGAVRIMRAQGVTIEGIVLDGGEPAPFSWSSVWEGRYPLFHGNAALTLYVAGDVIVRNCEVRNAYFGIYVKDRNDGGIYANANPADLQPQLVIPLSGFGKTGNHLFERNRFHDNSWGMYFESAWDLGSNVRYNLFYDNHHSKKLAAKVADMEEGGNQPGGGIFFKDMMLSPVAIYNNTFYHNNLALCANWRVGGQHLVFNNIIGAPDSSITSGHLALDPALPNRTFNTLYAAQEQKPQARSQEYTDGMQDPETNTYVQGRYTHKGYGWVSVMNAFPNLKPTVQTVAIEIPLSSGTVERPVSVDWDILPGTPIIAATAEKAFPQSANVRWLQIGFASTDPESPDFLTPDWEDTLIKKLVVDQGWPDGGIRDADGSIADLGAIPMGGFPKTEILVKPRDPVFIRNGTTAEAKFEIYPLFGQMSGPKVKYVRWIKNVPFFPDAFGGNNIKIIPQRDIVAVDVPSTPLVVGVNTLTFTIPQMDTLYGFFDIIIEGTGPDGKTVSTNVGFLPYRKIEYVFDVLIKDEAGTKELTSVQAGQSVQLWITPRRLDGKTFDAKIEEVSVTLFSDNDLLTPAGAKFALPGGIQGTSKSTVVFTKVPTGGFDGVEVSGKFANPNDADIYLPIRGSSGSIKIIPGPPELIRFQDPTSGGVGIVEPGTTDLVKVQAKDKYENNINSPTSITLVSTRPEIGTVITSPVMSDSSGLAQFRVAITKGDYLDTFPIVATLDVKKDATDNAKMVVGKPRDKLWIFYADVGAFDPDAAINGCSGIRVPVTVWASKDGKTPVAGQNALVTIDVSGGLAAYASGSADDTVRLRQATLENGAKVIYIKSTARNVAGGTISVFAADGSAVNIVRGNISFNPCNTSVKRAAYFADNGRGSVNRVEIYFEKALLPSELPDSLRFSWPGSEGESRLVDRAAMTLDSKDSTHITVALASPFAESVTRHTGSASDLGRYYWWNPLTPDAATQTGTFAIADSTGPLIAKAVVIERFLPGNDTLIIDFTEPVAYSVVKEDALTLLKRQADGSFTEVKITILRSQPAPNGSSVVAIVEDLEGNAPKEGDSLRITPGGPIVDASGNRAHSRNRPVVLTTKKVAPDIVAAIYEDRNADGKIETVRMTFRKSVQRTGLRFQFVWNGATVTTGDPALCTFSGGDSTVEVAVGGLFSEAVLTNRTSGAFNVIVTFTEYEENGSRSALAVDGAAPVLSALAYHYGRYSEQSGAAADTVYAEFSEPLKAPPTVLEPFLLQDTLGNRYSVQLSYLRLVGNRYQFKVEQLQSGAHPVGKTEEHKGDSAWINTAEATVASNVIDNQGNVQRNPGNIRVAITVNQPPFELKLQAGPNPFNPRNTSNDSRGFKIAMKAMTGVALPTVFVVSAIVYDKVGNVVKKIPDDDPERYAGSVRNGSIVQNDTCNIYWDGTNRQGRIVGIGTYLAALKISYTTTGVDPVVANEVIKIGVSLE